MPSRTIQHKNSLQSIHFFIELSSSLTKNIYNTELNHLKLILQKNE